MKFYRYYQVVYADGLRVYFEEIDLIEETPRGYWIGRDLNEVYSFDDRKHWVSKTSKKRYAYPTKLEALESFIARKTRQLEILKCQQINAKIALGIANKMKGETNE